MTAKLLWFKNSAHLCVTNVRYIKSLLKWKIPPPESIKDVTVLDHSSFITLYTPVTMIQFILRLYFTTFSINARRKLKMDHLWGNHEANRSPTDFCGDFLLLRCILISYHFYSLVTLWWLSLYCWFPVFVDPISWLGLDQRVVTQPVFRWMGRIKVHTRVITADLRSGVPLWIPTTTQITGLSYPHPFLIAPIPTLSLELPYIASGHQPAL